MGFDLEKLVNGLKTAPQNFKAIVKAEMQDWKTLPARVEEVNQFNKTKPKNMETKKLSRRDFLKISGIGSVAVTLVACGGEIGRRIVTPDRTKNQEPTYSGVVYNPNKKVFGFGDVSGDKIPTSKDLYGMALSGVQFEQTSPNSWTDVTPQLSMVIQGVNGANVIHDNEGRPLGGFYLNKAGMAQFMTRFGESLIFLSPDPSKVTKNSDSSITVVSHMVTRNDTGKWGLEPVEIPITLRFDAFGNVVAYDIPLLSSATPGATPTPSAEQKANFLVPREIAFRPTAVGMTATKEAPTQTPTATQEATATPASTATSTSRPANTATQEIKATQPPAPATSEPTRTQAVVTNIEWHVTDGGNPNAIMSQSNRLTEKQAQPFFNQIKARGNTTRSYDPNYPECKIGDTCYIIDRTNGVPDAIWIVKIVK